MVGVLVAVGAVDLETAVLPSLTGASDVHVVRRCVDVPDLVSMAATGQADAALVALPLPGLDADVVARLSGLDVTVVGVCDRADDADRATLERIGAQAVLDPDDLSGLPAVVDRLRREPSDVDRRAAHRAADRLDVGLRVGRLLAVWGPVGSPGRSTVALGLASEVTRLRLGSLIVDADVYGGAVAQLLGLLDESSGLLAACRAANVGALSTDLLARHTRQLESGTRVLTGLPRADRWTEVRPVLLRAVLDAARTLADVTIVDCGFSLERDEDIVYDTGAPRRNGATLEALSRADTIVVVGTADPVGLGRLIRGIDELSGTIPGVSPYVVVNRRRSSLGWSEDDIRGTVRRATGADVRAMLPDDPAACDTALVKGRSVGECAPDSRLSQALHRLAADLVGTAPLPGRRLRRRTTATAR
jgi:MinD-like ATPase involved in chromosome partitioning or flagellar assembly